MGVKGCRPADGHEAQGKGAAGAPGQCSLFLFQPLGLHGIMKGLSRCLWTPRPLNASSCSTAHKKLGLEVCLAVVWSLGESPGVEPSPLAEISGVVGTQDMV